MTPEKSAGWDDRPLGSVGSLDVRWTKAVPPRLWTSSPVPERRDSMR